MSPFYLHTLSCNLVLLPILELKAVYVWLFGRVVSIALNLNGMANGFHLESCSS